MVRETASLVCRADGPQPRVPRRAKHRDFYCANPSCPTPDTLYRVYNQRKIGHTTRNTGKSLERRKYCSDTCRARATALDACERNAIDLKQRVWYSFIRIRHAALVYGVC